MSENSKWNCVVCCEHFPSPKKKSIFGLGQCDHIVCYECSMRMRVLCKQNECAICRQQMDEVIFTLSTNGKFEDYDLSKCVHRNEEFGIYFEEASCVDAYGRLLEHHCRRCKTHAPFKSLHDLQTHLRKEHELFMCDICVDSLKVFSKERKYYTRKELVRHRKTGDPDETCHRGHPLCQFCDMRFLDDDDLQSHLRREHFYCHFCDPSGLSHFYKDYDYLRDHFKNEHFLCEECDNQSERFTCAFSSEIDLQAHIAQVHSHGLSKTDLKKARTLSLDLFIRPRAGGSLPTAPNMRKKSQKSRHAPIDEVDSEPINEEPIVVQAPVPRPEDFPQLSGGTNSEAAAVGINTVESNETQRQSNKTQRPPNTFSVLVSKNPSSITSNEIDFPALPVSNVTNPYANTGPSYSKKMSNDRSVSQNLSFKINQQNKSKPPRKPDIPKVDTTPLNVHTPEPPQPSFKKPLINNDFEFPALPAVKSKKKSNSQNGIKLIKDKHNEENVNLMSKRIDKNNSPKSNTNDEMNKILEISKTNSPLNLLEEFPILEKPQRKLNGPPGLGLKISPPKQPTVVPPPGLSSSKTRNNQYPKKTTISLSSVAQDMIGPNCSENSPSSAEEHSYLNPLDFNQRNQSLVTEIEHVLKDHSKFNDFKHASNDFRQNIIDADDYYKKCIELLGNSNLSKIFNELMVLLPDIKKQNELLSAHQSYLKSTKGAIPKKKGSWILKDNNNDFVICPSCHQVMTVNDGPDHMKMH